MTRSSSASILLLFLIGYTTAGLDSDRQPRAVQSNVCQEHGNLNTRLDVMEKRVEDTVEKLEPELAALVDAVEAAQWRPLLDAAGQANVDVELDPGRRGRS